MRNLVLIAQVIRSSSESNLDAPEAQEQYRDLIEHYQESIFRAEAEPMEDALIMSPLGALTSQQMINAGWRAEAAVVLTWSLGLIKRPIPHQRITHRELGEAIPFWDQQQGDILRGANPVSNEEIENFRREQITIHWRLNNIRMNGPERMDFREAIRVCDWDHFNGENLEFIDNDLAVNGTPVTQLSAGDLSTIASIVCERHIAANWLSGDDLLFSDITPDT